MHGVMVHNAPEPEYSLIMGTATDNALQKGLKNNSTLMEMGQYETYELHT